ncbi:ATP-binding protein [Megamonas funiformis]|uniref:ATP-binding protein n=1 Tax=Megamonas funiformis TaxID=437897 RepID=UPI003F873EF2
MKTTIATKFPRHLLLAFEKGYNAIPGAMAQPINTWAEFRKVLRQLKDEKVKEQFETIIIDTADIAYDLCEKYICANAKRPDGGFGVDSVSDIPFGKGYTQVAKEYDECLRSIIQMDYGLVLISHSVDKTFKDEQGQEYNQIVPTLGNKPRAIVSRMCDIIGYSRSVQDEEGKTSTKLFMRGTPRYIAGSRFKYTPDYIDFNYQSLVDAIGMAIDKQMEEDGSEYFTDERSNLYKDTRAELDFDELLNSFNTIVNDLIMQKSNEEFKEYWQPRIVQITDRYLGKGMKVSQCSRDQVEALDLIVTDLKELIKSVD